VPKVNDPKKLFAYKLSTVHASEKAILGMLRTAQKEAKDRELKSGFEKHAKETQQQIKNLEQAFSSLGEKPQEIKPRVVEALVTEHNQFTRQTPPPEILDAFLVGAAAHTEHHEISAYEGLITMAESMGEQDVVAVLRENLEQEQNMLQQVNQAAEKLSQQLAHKVPA
jgi:ferritin-like metal-binding protein YciE